MKTQLYGRVPFMGIIDAHAKETSRCLSLTHSYSYPYSHPNSLNPNGSLKNDFFPIGQ